MSPYFHPPPKTGERCPHTRQLCSSRWVVDLNRLKNLQEKSFVASNQRKILPVQCDERRPNLDGGHGKQDIIHQPVDSRSLSRFVPANLGQDSAGFLPVPKGGAHDTTCFFRLTNEPVHQTLAKGIQCPRVQLLDDDGAQKGAREC